MLILIAGPCVADHDIRSDRGAGGVEYLPQHAVERPRRGGKRSCSVPGYYEATPGKRRELGIQMRPLLALIDDELFGQLGAIRGEKLGYDLGSVAKAARGWRDAVGLGPNQ